MKLAVILAGLFVAIGMAMSAALLGDALVQSRQPQRWVTVKGLSEREVKADLGFWPVRFTSTGPDLQSARAGIEASETAVRDFLEQRGFEDGDIQVQNIQVEDRYAGYNAGNTPDDVRFVLTEDLLVRSSNVDALSTAARDVADLLRQGVVFASDSYSAGPSFVFTNITDLKSEMLTEATQRARDAAAQFATESDSRVGDIKTANQGVFEILPAVQIPNERPEKQIDKNVRVVTTITYFLTD